MTAGVARSIAGLVFALSVAAHAFVSVDSTMPLIDDAGTAALRSGKYAVALTELDSSCTVIDSGYHLFKTGLALQRTAQFEKAVPVLIRAARLCTLLAPDSYDLIARCALALDRPREALEAWRKALACRLPQSTLYAIQNNISTTVITHDIPTSELPWLGPWFTASAVRDTSTQRDVVRALVADGDWKALDSALASSLDGDDRWETCNLLLIVPVDSLPDGTIPTSRLFDAASRLQRCGRNAEARQWLARAEQRPDFASAVSSRRVTYLRGTLAYANRDDDEAVKWLKKFVDDYGPTPEMVITLARAYRRLGRSVKSGEWYDRHVQLYPNHSQTQDILWYRAWQREESGNFGEAIRLYRRMRTNYRNGSKAPDAMFREGLLHYRSQRPDSAFAVWKALLRAYPQSSTATAARYWQARALLARNKRADALQQYAEVVKNDPLDFYSYRAQEALREMGDTITRTQFVTTAGSAQTRRWLDSVSQKKHPALTAADSADYRASVLLAFCGLGREAHRYIEPILQRSITNLTLQFEISELYALCGMPTLSYRVARALAWRIPAEHRSAIPLGVCKALYPDAFTVHVDNNAAAFSLEPNLVLALIRQESMFDPEIRSPVGAIGLMQIMPYTGKEIAQDLEEPFFAESLTTPSVNVRYGMHYLRKLLDQFDGNMVLALAGYNGGPHNARRWFESNKDLDFDMFIENISYSETRGYVKRVLANYWIYNRLAKHGG